jgi:hypothetical protein
MSMSFPEIASKAESSWYLTTRYWPVMLNVSHQRAQGVDSQHTPLFPEKHPRRAFTAS